MRHSLEEITLKNGAKGLFIHVPGASVMDTRIQFRAGMRYAKTPELYEIAHVVEHLSFGANAKFKDEQSFEHEFAKNGAYHNAWTSDFSVCYESECADFEWKRIMDLQRISITQPRFNEEELKSEKATVRSELTSYMNEYPRLLWPRLQNALGEDVPSLNARLKTLPNIELKDIREHYRRTHTANNMRFIVAGRIRGRKHELIRMLENWELKPGERFAIPHDTLTSSPAVLIKRKDASNITFGFSMATPRRLAIPEIYEMNALNYILNGTLSSRIFGKARKRGLVYSMGSSLAPSFHNTSWDFDGEVTLESAGELFDLICTELGRVLNGDISEHDLSIAKSYALGRYQMGAQTVGQIADYYADGYFLGHEISPYNHAPALIKNIDKSNIVDLAREFAGSGINAMVAVSSCEKTLINELEERLNALF
ncbi:insulinase family protein [Candidatus Saccharibacteria bacterium]|nr:insulinase family protein [Candidatus Saccharibacteria bacterium]